jgi:SPP1 gp7 family putative phage head morphogenesis protein
MAYWIDRQNRIMDDNIKASEKYIVNVKRQYQLAYDSMKKELESFETRYGKSYNNANITLDSKQLSLFHDQIKNMIDTAKDFNRSEWEAELKELYKSSKITRYESLMAQIKNEIEIITDKQQKGMTELLSTNYENAYTQTAFNMAQYIGIGYRFDVLPTMFVKKAVARPWLGENYSDRLYNNKKVLIKNLSQTVTQGLIRGQGVQPLVKELKSKIDISTRNAERLILTETSHIVNEANYDYYNESGVVENYEYIATLDNRTSKICSFMDGQIIPLKNKETGINYPPLHPRCRSTTAPEILDKDKTATRIARDHKGQTYKVPETMTYKEWAKKYPIHAKK